MKFLISCIAATFLIGTIANAQIGLDVAGDARISGKIELGSSSSQNLFIGIGAGAADIGGTIWNTFVGYKAGNKNDFGLNNTFVGSEAGLNNTSAQDNTFIGANAGFTTSTGGSNTFVGGNAGRANVGGNANTYVGYLAGESATMVKNTFIGNEAGRVTSTGQQNAFLGSESGFNNSTGSNNTFVGEKSGNLNTTGSNNTIVGQDADVMSNGLTNTIAIGAGTMVDASNKVVIGNTSVTVIGGQVDWSVLSDQRYKKNINNERNHLDFILGLRPVAYQLNTLKLVRENQAQRIALAKANGLDTEIWKEKFQAEQQAAQQFDNIYHTGFLAQEVEQTMQKTAYKSFNGVVTPEINGGRYALRYAEFVVPLVGAVQTQQQQLEESQLNIEQLMAKNAELEAQLEQLKALVLSLSEKSVPPTTVPHTTIASANTHLQNQPNPFKDKTTITYQLPPQTLVAQLQISTSEGNIVQTLNLDPTLDRVIVDATSLPTGSYFYTLIADGRQVETKQMILQK